MRNLHHDLMAAIESNKPHIVKTLLADGADPSIGIIPVKYRNTDPELPLNVAAFKGFSEIVDILLASNKVDIQAKCRIANFMATPFQAALLDDKADISTIQKLISAPTDINYPIFCRNGRFTTPLHEAATRSYERTKYLLDNNANVNALDYERNTPLHKICDLSLLPHKEEYAVAMLLLEHGAAYGQPNGRNYTAIQKCAASNSNKSAFAKAIIDFAGLSVLDVKDRCDNDVIDLAHSHRHRDTLYVFARAQAEALRGK